MTKRRVAPRPARRRTPYQSSPVPPRFSQRMFDARPDRLDCRDLPYRRPLRSLPSQWPNTTRLKQLVPSYIQAGLILDQGSEGACTGFGLACVVNYLLWTRRPQGGARGRFLPVSPRMLYELARQYDEWPGEKYDGSRCRVALQGWHKHGVCREQLWPDSVEARRDAVCRPPGAGWEADCLTRGLGMYCPVERESVVDIQAALVDLGAVYVSARVHDGWDELLGTRRSPVPRQ